MSERFIRLVLGSRWVVLLVAAAITALSAAFLSRISFDNSIETWFLADDPNLAVYNRFTERFKADQIVIVGLFADDVFAPDVLAAVDQISQRAAGLKYAERVHSITRSVARVVAYDEPGFRDAVLDSPLQRELLLSSTNDATAIVIYYNREGNDFVRKRAFVTALQQIVDDAIGDAAIKKAISGAPVIGQAGQERNARDMRILVPVMIAVILVIAASIFQSVTMTLLPLGVSGVALVITYGLMAAIGWKMTMLSVILIPLVLAVSVAHSIHIIDRYRLNLERGLDNNRAVAESVERLLRPCLFACITTVIGLLSLLVSDLGPLHEFAVSAAAGVSAAFLGSVTVLPVLLAMRGGKLRQRSTLARELIRDLLVIIHRAAAGHPRSIVAVGFAMAIMFTWLASRVETGIDTLSWIRHDDPIRVDSERIDEAFGGALSLEFLLLSDVGQLGDPALLRRIESFQVWLVNDTTVGRSASLADLVKEATRAARDAGPEGYSLPRSRFLTRDMLGTLEREGQLTPWVSPDFREARIAARVPLSSAQDIIGELPAIRARIAETFSDSGVTVHLTGHAVLASNMQSYMLSSQIYSFGVALAVVSLVMVVLLRSFTLGALAMIPNLVPIAAGLGAMSLFGVTLSPATVMIAAVALGIVVDDTVHLMTDFERALKRTRQVGEAIRRALLDVGQPVLVTSILLASGFATLVLGSFLPTREIGGIVALIVIAALLTDLVFLPAVLRSLPKRFLLSDLPQTGAASPAGD